MSRIHGRNGVVYVGVNNNDAASPVAFLADWTINFTVAKVDVTCLGDTNLVYVAGLPDASGDFSGFFDNATVQTYLAAVDGLPRNYYLYPSTNTTSNYFFGTILPDYSVAGGVATAVSVKSTFNAASQMQQVGGLGG
jgi:hypothetical protein